MQPSSYKTSLNYGAMSALACFAMFLLIYWMGNNPLGPSSWLAVWITPLFIVLSIRHFRDRQRGGLISYGDAFLTGFLTAASCGLLYALIIYIFGTVIDAGLIDDLKESTLAKFEEGESMMRSMIGDAFYDQTIEELKNTTLRTQATSEFFSKSFFGAFVSLIAAAIMKRKPADKI